MNATNIIIGLGLFAIGMLITLVVSLLQKTDEGEKKVAIKGMIISAVASLILNIAGNYIYDGVHKTKDSIISSSPSSEVTASPAHNTPTTDLSEASNPPSLQITTPTPISASQVTSAKTQPTETTEPITAAPTATVASTTTPAAVIIAPSFAPATTETEAPSEPPLQEEPQTSTPDPTASVQDPIYGTITSLTYGNVSVLAIEVNDSQNNSTVCLEVDNDVPVFKDAGDASRYTDLSAARVGQECAVFFDPDGEVAEIDLIYPTITYEDGILENLDFIHIVGQPAVSLEISFSDGTTEILRAHPGIADFSYDLIGKVCTFTRDGDGIINYIVFGDE